MRRRGPKVYGADPAFPAGTKRGVTKREYFMGRIAQVLVADANRRGVSDPAGQLEVMRAAASWADALIAALNEPQEVR